MQNRCWFKDSQLVNVLPQQVQEQMVTVRPQQLQQVRRQVSKQGLGQDQGQWQRQARRQGQRQANRNNAEWICQVCEKKFVSREEKFIHIGRVHENRAGQTSSVSHLWCQFQDKCSRSNCKFKHFEQGFQKENMLRNRQ